MSVGVITATATRSAPSADQQIESSTYFPAGQTERGPTNIAVRVASLGDFERTYGGRISYGALYDDLQTHFEEGGVAAYIARVVGPSATVASLTLVDKAGTPLNTLRIDAFGPGAWAQGVTVAVTAGTTSGSYKVTVTYGGTGTQGTKVYDNLVTPNDAVLALQNSPYVRATDLGSATASPNNQPANISATPLSGGNDDRASINAARYTGALALFDADLGSGAVAIPGQSSAAIGAGLVAHAVATNRIAIVAPPINTSLNDAITASSTLAAAVPQGQENVGLFWPWVKVPNGSGGTRTISPEGFVAAKRAQVHEGFGPAQPPIATRGIANFVLDTETPVSKVNVDTAEAGNVSAITIVNRQVELYGWWSLSADQVNYELLSARDTVNYVAVAADQLLEEFVGRTIDGRGQLFADMEAKMIGFLDPLRNANQLFERRDTLGNQVDPGYRVDTGPNVNTSTTIQANEAHIQINIRPAPAAKLIIATIAKVPVTGAV